MKQKIIAAATHRILFSPHAVKQMSRPSRMITTDEVQKTVLLGDIIEGYLDDPRGESCLMCHTTQDRTIHVVCTPKTGYLVVITAYLPSPEHWSIDFKQRK